MRALKALVIGMGALIVAGTVTLVVLLVQRVSGTAPVAMPTAASLGQPPGTRIFGITTLDHRLAVAISGPEGDRVLLWDPRTGRVEGQLRLGE